MFPRELEELGDLLGRGIVLRTPRQRDEAHPQRLDSGLLSGGTFFAETQPDHRADPKIVKMDEPGSGRLRTAIEPLVHPTSIGDAVDRELLLTV